MLQMKVRYSDYFAVEPSAGATLVRFEAESVLDGQASQDAAADLHRLVDQQGMADLVVDMAGVQFLSSAAIGTLVDLQRKCGAAGGGLVLIGVSPGIARMFHVTGLDTLLAVQGLAQTPLETVEGPGGCAVGWVGR